MSPCFDEGTSLFNFVVRDGNGVKGLVDSGLQNVPERYIQPPAERINPNNAGLENFPPIDLSKLDGPNRDAAAAAIVRAAETVGFFQVVNHGLPVELLESVKDAAHKFFGQSPEKKAVYRKGTSPSPLVKYGTSFVPEKEKALEWKDYVSMVYTGDAEALEHWPSICRETSLEYLKNSVKMVKRILEVLFENLGVKMEESAVDSLVGHQMVNMNFYPACPNPDLTVGVGRHSDLGILTVLLQDGIGGLYVKVEDDEENQQGKKEGWMAIPPIPGALVINVGDSLQILSNGRYKSAEHRVRTTSKQARVSIPVFTVPRPTEKIGPLPEVVERDGCCRYRDFLFADYMNNFFGNAHDGKKSLDFVKNVPK